jgi:hypothetical protein
MVAFPTAVLLLITSQGPGQGKGKGGKKKNAPPKEIEDIDPTGRFDGGIIDQSSSFFLWFDDGEWRLRTGSTNRKTNFTGTIKAKNGTFASWHGAGLDKGKKNPDVFRINNDRTELTFSFVTAGRADGINFKIKGDDAILEFALNADGRNGPRVVKIGKEKQNPSGMPFRIRAKPPESEDKPKKPGKKESSE